MAGALSDNQFFAGYQPSDKTADNPTIFISSDEWGYNSR